MDVLGIEHNFLALEETYSSYDKSPVVIQSLPYEHTSSYHKGSAGGPEALLKASHFVEFYDEELDQETVFDLGGIATLPILDFKGATDAAAMDLITEETRKLLKDEKFVVSIGSEHSITYGIIRAFVEKFGSNFSILQIDAHSDLREAYQGNPFSHASAMARCLETDVHLTQVGIRAQCIEESKVCKEHPKVTTIYAHQLDEAGEWMKTVMKSLKDHVYITVDADGFDPSVMPSVGTAEPNGLSWQQATRLLKKVCLKRKVLGFDIVEFIPREADTITEYNCAKLAYKMIGYTHKS